MLMNWVRASLSRGLTRDRSIRAMCPICGGGYSLPINFNSREGKLCPECGASGRSSAIVYYTCQIAYENTKPLAEQPKRKDFRVIGLSDGAVYANVFATRFDYTNTFYHKDPKLDIRNPNSKYLGSSNLVICSEVFEHVVGETQDAFRGAFSLLKPGGHLIFTVPFVNKGESKEHYPGLLNYSTRQLSDGSWVVDLEYSNGVKRTDHNPRFHGGPGLTLEVRLFNRDRILAELQEAGFVDIQVHDDNLPEHGISWSVASRVITARRRSEHASITELSGSRESGDPVRNESMVSESAVAGSELCTGVNNKSDNLAEIEMVVSSQNALSLNRARTNWEVRMKNEIAHFSRAYRQPMFQRNLKSNAFAYAQRIIQEGEISDPIHFAARAYELCKDRKRKILTICCGAARVEESLFKNCVVKPDITLVDINKDLLEMAAHRMKDVADSSFIVGDANQVELPQQKYDIAICVSGLHHIVELERLFAQLARCLVPGGEFWSIGEYVGRNGARLWPESYEVANAIFSSLPEKYRRNNVSVLDHKPIDKTLSNVDCSVASFEGIRAEEIEDTIVAFFEQDKINKWSTIAWRVIGPAYVDNYDIEDEADREIVREIAQNDIDYFRSGTLKPVGMRGIFKPRTRKA